MNFLIMQMCRCYTWSNVCTTSINRSCPMQLMAETINHVLQTVK